MQFLLHFGDSFQSNVTFAGPWNSLGQQCRISQIHGLWKRNAPTGWAAPPRTSPESESNFRGIMKHFSKILQKTLPFAFRCFTFFYLRKRLPDSLLKIDAISGLVRGGGARPPGALLLHHSAWSAQGPALSPSAVPGWTDHQSVSRNVTFNLSYFSGSRIQMSPTPVPRF